MDVEYRVDGDELALDLLDPRAPRRQTWNKLVDLGAPLELEPTPATVKARCPKQGIDELADALALLDGELVPADGEPDLQAVQDEQPRYEDVRPVSPEDVVDEARDSEHPRRAVKQGIRELGVFAMENPGFEHRVERDQDYLRTALERLFPKDEGDEQAESDPVKRKVSQTLKSVPDDDKWRARELLLDLHQVREDVAGERPIAEVPEIPSFRGELRGYQETGVGFLLGTEFDAILADEMGLGKTVTTIAAILAADTHALVVAPANVLHNWASEIRRFTGEKAAIWHGRDVHGPDDARFRVTTYTSLAYRDWRDTDADERPVLVLDEAHKIRNPDTQRARLVDDLPQEHRVLLTGTPIVNGLMDYNQLLQQVDEDAWSDRDFEQTWLDDPQVMRRNPEVRAAVADLLQEATRQVTLRRRKADVLDDLPPRTVSVVPHQLDEDARKRYEGLEQRAREAMSKDDATVEVFARLHEVRQFLIDKRLPAIAQRIRDIRAEGHACVVYAHYLDPLDELEDALDDTARITGDTPPSRREEIASELGEPGGPQILLAQMEAGGVGLNFVGATHVIFTHLGWTAAVHSQAIDRVHRIGQDEPVNVEFFVTPDTFDERLVNIILRKEQDANLALADQQDTLNRNELAEVLLEDE